MTKPEAKRAFTYFGGEIINPNSDYIILTKDHRFAGDTIYLDENNKFLHKIEDLKEGLYSFRHRPETQLIILEKGDSVLIRLNTLEFDESLVFTGDGSRKNNFLIDMFLLNEIERNQMGKEGFNMSPSKFRATQDSLLTPRLESLNRITKKYKLSPLSKKICKASFIYDFKSRYELYAYRHKNSGIVASNDDQELPISLLDNRKDTNFNDEDLKRLYSYNRFMNRYFTNIAFTRYSNNGRYPKNLFKYTEYKLNLVDSMVQHSYIKNNLLRGITRYFILNNKNDYTTQKILNHYLSISTNNKFQQELKKLAFATSRLKPNNPIPDQDLITSNGENIKLSSLFEKPITALYFWSTEKKDHYIRAHKKASYLSEMYPEIDFIAINTDDSEAENWQRTIKRNRYDLTHEYEFKFPKCSSQELVIHNRNKVILVDQKGKIINPNTDLFSISFEKQLISYYSGLATKEK